MRVTHSWTSTNPGVHQSLRCARLRPVGVPIFGQENRHSFFRNRSRRSRQEDGNEQSISELTCRRMSLLRLTPARGGSSTALPTVSHGRSDECGLSRHWRLGGGRPTFATV